MFGGGGGGGGIAAPKGVVLRRFGLLTIVV